ncbi:MAG: hypothetical protein CL675_11855 [Bdellovibrionaceae bacterium]|nr:hypothetical protein [Pseudobdellovibrionaceae bacterium]
MNTDIVEGKWKQLKGDIKKTWAKITDDEIDQVKGDFDVLAGKIQERYGCKKEEARDQVNQFLKKFRSSETESQNTSKH